MSMWNDMAVLKDWEDKWLDPEHSFALYNEEEEDEEEEEEDE